MKKLPPMFGVYGLMVPGGFWLGWSSVEPGTMAPVLAALGMTLAGYVFLLVFVYNKWKAIQDGQTRSSAGLAVGLLLVPLFNFYWAFRVWPGFVDEYNKYIARNGLDAPELPRKPYTALVVCGMASSLPVVGVIAALGYIILLGVTISLTCDAVNAINRDEAWTGMPTDADDGCEWSPATVSASS